MNDKRPFWSGISGVLAGTAGVIGAVAGLIGILIQLGVIGGGGESSSTSASGGNPTWAVQANEICQRTNDSIQALPNPKIIDPNAAGATESLANLGRGALKINQLMVRQLGALQPPAEKREHVEQFVRLGARINEETEEMLADVRTGNLADLQARQQTLSTLGRRFDAAAVDLGASTCAEGASFAGGLPTG
jgi:hypothetical protein